MIRHPDFAVEPWAVREISLDLGVLAQVESIFALEEANLGHPETEDVLEGAKYVQSTVIPAMEASREIGDRLERVVPDSLWPLPKYAEILFIK